VQVLARMATSIRLDGRRLVALRFCTTTRDCNEAMSRWGVRARVLMLPPCPRPINSGRSHFDTNNMHRRRSNRSPSLLVYFVLLANQTSKPRESPVEPGRWARPSPPLGLGLRALSFRLVQHDSVATPSLSLRCRREGPPLLRP
jgi:hypothetical protein